MSGRRVTAGRPLAERAVFRAVECAYWELMVHTGLDYADFRPGSTFNPSAPSTLALWTPAFSCPLLAGVHSVCGSPLS